MTTVERRTYRALTTSTEMMRARGMFLCGSLDLSRHVAYCRHAVE